MKDTYDLIVVGAGWFGIAAARTYIALHPDEKILILDADTTFGGTWSANRLYHGLKSNNLWGSYEYPDFPMTEEKYGVSEGQHIPAAVLHKYLTDVAEESGVAQRTQFGTKVDTITPTADDEWVLKVSQNGDEKEFQTKRLILATGLTSQPNFPTYPGQETFTSKIFHAKDFAQEDSTVGEAKRVVVVGGGKSAYDIAYAYAAEGGAQVDMVIRSNGQGPVWLCPPYVTPFKRKLEELLNTRCLTWFSPCPWGDEDGYSAPRSFLHNTAFGRILTDNYWAMMSNEVVETHGFDDDPELFKLKPWQPSFWTGSGVGIHNFDSSLYELVRQRKIRVHIADIASLNKETVHLTDGASVDADVVVCATGWKKESSIRFEGLSKQGHGLPGSPEEVAKLGKEADKEVHTLFPRLKNQPTLRFQRKEEEPLRNYRFIVPVDSVPKRNLAFAGMASTVSTAMFATVQALWISAFFDNKLSRLPAKQEAIVKSTVLHTQFGKWRYPVGYGANLPDFAFDALPYVDLLLNDLGVKHHRKATAIAEITEPYKPWDYKNIIDEWSEKNGVKVNGNGAINGNGVIKANGAVNGNGVHA